MIHKRYGTDIKDDNGLNFLNQTDFNNCYEEPPNNFDFYYNFFLVENNDYS